MRRTTHSIFWLASFVLLASGNRAAFATAYQVTSGGGVHTVWSIDPFKGTAGGTSVAATTPPSSSFDRFTSGNTYEFAPASGLRFLDITTANTTGTFGGDSLTMTSSNSILSVQSSGLTLDFAAGRPLILNGGVVVFNAASGKVTGDVRVTASGGLINQNQQQYVEMAGNISNTISGNGGGIIIYRGGSGGNGGTIGLSGANTYSGDTQISFDGEDSREFAVRIGSTASIPSGATKGNVVFNAAANDADKQWLDLNGYNTSMNALITKYAPNNAATRVVRGAWNDKAGSGSVTLTLGNGDASGTFGGILENGNTYYTLGLTKVGTGTQTFSGTNTYTGLTKISGGTLALSGAGAISSSLDLDGGTLALASKTGNLTLASLIGNGDITGGKTVTVNTSFGPGHSVGLINHTGDFVLGGSSTTAIDIDLTSSTFDELNVLSGTLTYGGTLNVTFTGSSLSAASFNIFDFTSFTSNFSAFNYSGLAGGQTASWDETTGIVSITAVPEPSTFAMLLFGSLMMWLVGRKRR